VNRVLLILLVVCLCLPGGCKKHTQTASEEEYGYKYYMFDIEFLNYDDLPYTWKTPGSLEGDLTDEDGVILHEKYGYHPVLLAQKILRYCDSYQLVREETYLEKAILFADKMLQLASENDDDIDDDIILFPYNFDFPLHGYPDETIRSPWYSGMAQGQVLSAFVRLYNIIEDDKYKDAARKVFNSFFTFKDINMPWISYIDHNKYVWIEEYPMEDPTNALNGFIFAIYGLYDYYLLTQDSKCKEILLACLTTVKDNIHLFRNKDDLSYYCLKHKVKSESYHKVHIDQLEMLFLITQDRYFSAMAELFNNDLLKYQEMKN